MTAVKQATVDAANDVSFKLFFTMFKICSS